MSLSFLPATDVPKVAPHVVQFKDMWKRLVKELAIKMLKLKQFWNLSIHSNNIVFSNFQSLAIFLFKSKSLS